ncbi:hypothetical protein PSACC_02923 [Paramicrosporidium saccamoebae]|uniref:Uncharacterized protein n=1 Tax=Paramicrosporidium saccamoebae TaxID=1246581 RepID=A0A2H9THN2_9FUNG|nr:hypothetical protein PSACC_02923 [Paramicrosporidium saccamoebae]
MSAASSSFQILWSSVISGGELEKRKDAAQAALVKISATKTKEALELLELGDYELQSQVMTILGRLARIARSIKLNVIPEDDRVASIIVSPLDTLHIREYLNTINRQAGAMFTLFHFLSCRVTSIKAAGVHFNNTEYSDNCIAGGLWIDVNSESVSINLRVRVVPLTTYFKGPDDDEPFVLDITYGSIHNLSVLNRTQLGLEGPDRNVFLEVELGSFESLSTALSALKRKVPKIGRTSVTNGILLGNSSGPVKVPEADNLADALIRESSPPPLSRSSSSCIISQKHRPDVFLNETEEQRLPIMNQSEVKEISNGIVPSARDSIDDFLCPALDDISGIISQDLSKFTTKLKRLQSKFVNKYQRSHMSASQYVSEICPDPFLQTTCRKVMMKLLCL